VAPAVGRLALQRSREDRSSKVNHKPRISNVAGVFGMGSPSPSASAGVLADPEARAAAEARGWIPPHAGSLNPHGLVVLNSLCDTKVPFVPREGPDSRRVTWYNCGPTVYDAAHMGHARNYLSVDIIRRVLTDWFGYEVTLCMNITDVDDKIIKRARQGHVLACYATEARAAGADACRARCAEAAATAATSAEAKERLLSEEAEGMARARAEGGTSAPDGRAAAAAAEAAAGAALVARQARDAASALASLSADASVDSLLAPDAPWRDALAAHLDAERGASVTDPAIFRAHAARFERSFLDDMASLAIRPPTVMPRVSEYVPDIVAYVDRLVRGGMAYSVDDAQAADSNAKSVYFDTEEFRASGHRYGKLAPWCVGVASLAAEGEVGGTTSVNAARGGKRSTADFALWKASKRGEPAWPSPWGPGRPGWHIECSAMARAVLGRRMDVHSGGSDLRFPHHTNEMAQAEAYHHLDRSGKAERAGNASSGALDDGNAAPAGCDEVDADSPGGRGGCCPSGCGQWVDYFFHTGHLHIEAGQLD